MTNPKGYRRGTRYLFQREFKKNGPEHLSTYLKVYKIGDIVDIKVNGSIHKGMPHKYYHGKTGTVFNVTKGALGVFVNKKVGNRIVRKRLNVRIEHLKHSTCRQDFLQRVKENDRVKSAARAEGKPVPQCKRQPVGPKAQHHVSTKNNAFFSMDASFARNTANVDPNSSNFLYPVDVRLVPLLGEKGLFIGAPCPAGALVMQTDSDKVVLRPWDEIPESHRSHAVCIRHMSTDKEMFLDVDPAKDVFAYINHSCDPTLHLIVGTLNLASVRDLQPGDELTVDYVSIEGPKSGNREWHKACACGAAACRKDLTQG